MNFISPEHLFNPPQVRRLCQSLSFSLVHKYTLIALGAACFLGAVLLLVWAIPAAIHKTKAAIVKHILRVLIF